MMAACWPDSNFVQNTLAKPTPVYTWAGFTNKESARR